MNIFQEYLAKNERDKAAKEGLSTAIGYNKLDEKEKTDPISWNTSEWIKKYIRNTESIKEFFIKLRNDANKIIYHPWRGIYIFKTNMLYTCPSKDAIHDDIILALIFGGVLKINEEEYLGWYDTKIKNLIALISVGPKTVKLAESYESMVEDDFFYSSIKNDEYKTKRDKLIKYLKSKNLNLVV